MIFCFIAQIHREFRKPLVVMAPKNLLRHKDCKSNLSEFDDVQGHPGFDKQGTRFKRLIKDQNDHSDLEEGIRRLVLCSGKVTLLTFFFPLDSFIKYTGSLWLYYYSISFISYLWGYDFRCFGFAVNTRSTLLQICFLQVYYELDEERKKVDAKDIAICRVEQLCPFPYNLIQRELKRYPSMYFELAKKKTSIMFKKD
jgi:2-oxoglutarate dehydrogenase complex dehydrogenase (E1) component-like enzyme